MNGVNVAVWAPLDSKACAVLSVGDHEGRLVGQETLVPAFLGHLRVLGKIVLQRCGHLVLPTHGYAEELDERRLSGTAPTDDGVEPGIEVEDERFAPAHVFGVTNLDGLDYLARVVVRVPLLRV